MKYRSFAAVFVASCSLASTTVAAQEASEASDTVVEVAVDAAVVEPVSKQAKPCELHVWPTENYLGVKMGLFSGFGIIGALADQAGHKKGVATVKELMREFLGPDVQMAELEKLSYVEKLGLSPELYEVIVHDPTPWNEDVKKDKALKAEVKELNQKIKDGRRISDSKNPCYAELITTHIFYHKAMMYGSNLFTGWVYRKYEGDTMVGDNRGQVKNPLEDFPPKEEAMVEAAKAELRDAYAKDFVEWVEKKSGV